MIFVGLVTSIIGALLFVSLYKTAKGKSINAEYSALRSEVSQSKLNKFLGFFVISIPLVVVLIQEFGGFNSRNDFLIIFGFFEIVFVTLLYFKKFNLTIKKYFSINLIAKILYFALFVFMQVDMQSALMALALIHNFSFLLFLVSKKKIKESLT